MRRQYLDNTILLAGDSDGKEFTRRFTIKSVVSSGASVVCYEAYHEGSSVGTLREYYPVDADFLAREKDGQLVINTASADKMREFKLCEEKYLEPYNMLLKAKKNDESMQLATFIPAFEIYHGCDESGKIVGTTYIWTPDPKLETFEHICQEIHNNPNQRPEHKLVQALTAIETLTKCICALHEAELIHRDIKPSNFGFVNRGGEALTQAISMFDINSICSVYDDIEEAMGSIGYMEPEAGKLPVSNQTDIYAIGATLFHAIIVTDETKNSNYAYNHKMYRELTAMVDESALIKASENNSHPRLRHALAKILKKSLAKRSNRYENCEEMLEDIRSALYYALPSEVAKKQTGSTKWVLNDIEKALDPAHEKNTNQVIKYHLYSHPLYQYADSVDLEADEENLDVMVLGFGNYSQRFLDICLEMGQMPGGALRVTVVTDSDFDRDLYLVERPALRDFFNIDEKKWRGKDSYGEISFAFKALSGVDEQVCEGQIKDIFEKIKKMPTYFFIALGDDEINRQVAQVIERLIVEEHHKACISFAQEKKMEVDIGEGYLTPVYVNEEVKKTADVDNIIRMARNTHKIWEKEAVVAAPKESSKQRKDYNLEASIAHVLFIKYMLYAIGINLDEISSKEAVERLESMGFASNNSRIKDILCFAEHKRWVVEKICQGWRQLEDISGLVRGNTKDLKSKKHICIVRCEENRQLTLEYGDNNFEKWDSATSTELKKLDDLDRLSIDFHRMYVRRAKELRKIDFINDFMILGIQRALESIPSCNESFENWYSCARALWDGDSTKIKEYDGLLDKLMTSLNNVPNERKKAMREHIKAFDLMFYPIIGSQRHLDFKYEDEILINKIPEIIG